MAQSTELADGSSLKTFTYRGHVFLDEVEGQSIVICPIVVSSFVNRFKTGQNLNFTHGLSCCL